MRQTFVTHSADETRALGAKLAQAIAPGVCLCLYGDLGAGKTTFVQGLLDGLGATPPYTSPTFVIMKQYDLSVPTASSIERVYHADAYRVEAHDFETLGFSEWCADPNGIVILEWPERVANIIPQDAIKISFISKSENEREIIFAEHLPE